MTEIKTNQELEVNKILSLSGPAWPATAVTILIVEYQDYKNGQ